MGFSIDPTRLNQSQINNAYSLIGKKDPYANQYQQFLSAFSGGSNPVQSMIANPIMNPLGSSGFQQQIPASQIANTLKVTDYQRSLPQGGDSYGTSAPTMDASRAPAIKKMLEPKQTTQTSSQDTSATYDTGGGAGTSDYSTGNLGQTKYTGSGSGIKDSGMTAVNVSNYKGTTVSPEIRSLAGKSIIDTAHSAAGIDYSWGGGGNNGPSRGIEQGANTTGFDCSGYVQFTLHQNGVQVGGDTLSQISDFKNAGLWHGGTLEGIHPGDPVYFSTGENSRHTGIYIGTDKKGNIQMWAAPSTGDKVRIQTEPVGKSLLGYGAATLAVGKRQMDRFTQNSVPQVGPAPVAPTPVDVNMSTPGNPDPISSQIAAFQANSGTANDRYLRDLYKSNYSVMPGQTIPKTTNEVVSEFYRSPLYDSNGGDPSVILPALETLNKMGDAIGIGPLMEAFGPLDNKGEQPIAKLPQHNTVLPNVRSIVDLNGNTYFENGTMLTADGQVFNNMPGDMFNRIAGVQGTMNIIQPRNLDFKERHGNTAQMNVDPALFQQASKPTPNVSAKSQAEHSGGFKPKKKEPAIKPMLVKKDKNEKKAKWLINAGMM